MGDAWRNLTQRNLALRARVTHLEQALELLAEGEKGTLVGAVAQAALDGESYRDLDHYDKARDERAEGLNEGDEGDDVQ